MKKVLVEDIVDYLTWQDELKPKEQERIWALKRDRRIHVGPYLTFLFENTDTVRYQIQEMMRVELIVKTSAIAHEIDTYNELLGGDGELGCVLLIEIDDPELRDVKLREWLAMPNHLYVRLPDDSKVYVSFDPRQIGDDRLSSVQYLKFATGGQTPVAVGCDLPGYVEEETLGEAARAALAADLAH